MKEENFNEAEEILRQAMDSVVSINHPNIFFPMEALSDVLYEKSRVIQTSDAILAKEYKDQAKDLLSKAIHIVEERISPQSDHLIRMRKKMKRF